jgi:uncharacterized membrane protein
MTQLVSSLVAVGLFSLSVLATVLLFVGFYAETDSIGESWAGYFAWFGAILAYAGVAYLFFCTKAGACIPLEVLMGGSLSVGTFVSICGRRVQTRMHLPARPDDCR